MFFTEKENFPHIFYIKRLLVEIMLLEGAGNTDYYLSAPYLICQLSGNQKIEKKVFLSFFCLLEKINLIIAVIVFHFSLYFSKVLYNRRIHKAF